MKWIYFFKEMKLLFWCMLCSQQAESGGSGIVARRVAGQAGSDEFVTKIPNNKVRRGVM